MDVDWREHQRWVRLDGSWANVIDLGPEDPDGTVVFIHGLSGSWQNWLENLPHFAERYRCIAMDLPGFGASEMPRERISIRGYGAFVDALLRELGVERAAVVGNSMGGFIGVEVALSFPTIVDRLVLVSAAGLSIEHQRNDRMLAVLRRAENVLTMYGGWLASRSAEFTRRPRSRHLLFNIVAEHPDRLPPPLVAEQLRGSGKPGFLDALDALSSYPIRDRLGDIAVPTLVVWGEDDKLVPVRDAWEFGRLIPDSEVVVYEDTGHVAMLERPAAFNALVGDFLDR
ncbi:MAG: alpha/beta hydrolase [Solirubrobacterales bacterium]|nr:alpha/beta hydrolase [Solirubrobacterales bacterium]